MPPNIAIVGSGPTALYTLKHLLTSGHQYSICIYEKNGSVGVGYPYGTANNTSAMLSNIASMEIPPLVTSLYDWLLSKSDAELAAWDIRRDTISERGYHPRIALGAYFENQFDRLCQILREQGHTVEIKIDTAVTDIAPTGTGATVITGTDMTDVVEHHFDNVIVATGHQFSNSATRRDAGVIGWRELFHHTDKFDFSRTGIIGSSLSAIDAAVLIAQRLGSFKKAGQFLRYQKRQHVTDFSITMMSRNGVLPEADFYYHLPLPGNVALTKKALLREVVVGSTGLLDRIFNLFKKEIEAADPAYAIALDFELLNPDNFSDAYFAPRYNAEPFTWAKENLLEATTNHKAKRVVAWREAILRCHEVFAEAVPHFNAADLMRFSGGLKTVFADNYAAVPLKSIARLIALNEAGILDVVSLGDDYDITEKFGVYSCVVENDQDERQFSCLIEARGQRFLSVDQLPFPTLRLHLMADAAKSNRALRPTTPRAPTPVYTDAAAQLNLQLNPIRGVYFWAIPFLLDRRPFIQGLEASNDIAQKIVASIAKTSDPSVAQVVNSLKNNLKTGHVMYVNGLPVNY